MVEIFAGGPCPPSAIWRSMWAPLPVAKTMGAPAKDNRCWCHGGRPCWHRQRWRVVGERQLDGNCMQERSDPT